MRNTITVMNAKGGVGKSTLVLAITETLATHHRKKILVIDADAQASVSHMLAGSPSSKRPSPNAKQLSISLLAPC